MSIRSLPLPAVGCDASGRIDAFSPDAERVFAGDLSALRVDDLFPGDDDLLCRLRTGRPLRAHGRRRNGVPFTADVACAPREGGGLLLVVSDMNGDHLLSESRRFLDDAFEHMPTGMAIFNTDGQYVRVNSELCRMLRHTPGELLARRDQELTHPEDRASDVEAARRILAGEISTWQTEKRFIRSDGHTVWALANLAFLRDEAGHPLCWVGQFQDITVRKRNEHRLRHIAEHDDLTGLANRRRLVTELELRLEHASRHDEGGAVLVLDLDGFKAINDTRGHDAGDDVLARVAIALRRRLRVTDTLARLGGDEFAAILPHADADAALGAAQALLEAVRSASPEGITASCGIALYGPDRPGTPEAVLTAADRAMYDAKQCGRDGARLAAAA